MAKRTIAIMGATGHIGSTLADRLLAQGHAVLALGRDEKKLAALAAKGATTRSAAFTDPEALAEGFAGAEAAFVMIPPSYAEADFGVYQDRQSDAIVKALRKSGVQKVVALSSVGAQHPRGTGPIAGLHRMEERLNQGGVDAVHLRPSYFMENHLFTISVIKSMGVYGSPLRGDLSFAQIATKDIAEKAAELLDRPEFRGSTVQEIGGPRDVTMADAAAALGRAVGKPDLKYVQFSYAEAEKAMIGMGMPPGTAALMIEMERGMNEGLVVPERPLAPGQRGRTTIEDFASSVFAPAFRS